MSLRNDLPLLPPIRITSRLMLRGRRTLSTLPRMSRLSLTVFEDAPVGVSALLMSAVGEVEDER